MTDEANIVIDGKVITRAQSGLVRIAVSAFHSEMSKPEALGSTENNKALARAYRDRAQEVLEIIFKAIVPPPEKEI